MQNFAFNATLITTKLLLILASLTGCIPKGPTEKPKHADEPQKPAIRVRVDRDHDSRPAFDVDVDVSREKPNVDIKIQKD